VFRLSKRTYVEEVGPVDRLLVLEVWQVGPELAVFHGDREDAGGRELQEVRHLDHAHLVVVEELQTGSA